MVDTITGTIGIDISKALLDVATYPDGQFKQFTNNKKDHKELLKWFGTLQVKRIVFEATGAYHRGLERFLGEHRCPFAKINPRQARRFAKATGTLVKTDRVDALMLARFGELLEPPHSVSKSQTFAELDELVVARRALVKDKTAAKNRQHNLRSSLLKRQTKQRLKQIKDQIETIDARCMALVQSDVLSCKRYNILISIPGLGSLTAIIILSEMPELGTMDKRQTAALAGLAPVARQSGTWKGKSFIRGGRANLRQALYMPTLVAIRFNEEMADKYKSMKKAGNPPKWP